MKLTHKALCMIWSIFALMFLGLAVLHSIAATRSLPTLGMPTVSPDPGQAKFQFGGVSHEQANKAWGVFQTEINQHIADMNHSSSVSNLCSAAGYVVAFFTALFSALIEVFPRSRPEEGMNKSCPTTGSSVP
ncbi:MAG TPA: hypothetical protein PLE77_03550 [Kiritimatiellia bacterium]|nr:hypothetical protein [Kiritimatiellia bacterium]